jgi:hypothetical protein
MYFITLDNVILLEVRKCYKTSNNIVVAYYMGKAIYFIACVQMYIT